MKKKITLSLTAVVLVLSSLTACSSGGGAEPTVSPNGTSNQEKGSATSETKQPIKIEIVQDGTVQFPENDFIKKALLDKLNIDLTMTVEPTEYISKLNTRVAGGNFPDLMILDKNQAQKYSESGALLDFGPYMDKLPDYVSFLGKEELKKGLFQGEQYTLPKVAGKPTGTYWIRKDWLDALGLSMPTTIDELFKVAKAFTENDPDKNNKKDTFGITGTELNTFAPVFGAYGLANTGSHLIKDNKLSNALYDPAMKDALAEVKRFIDAGVVDPEFLSNKTNVAKDKAFQGKFGIIYEGWSGIVKADAKKVWKGANPNTEWEQLGALKGPSEKSYVSSVELVGWLQLLAVPKNMEKDPEKLNKILELINYVSSEEGNLLVSYGLKDEHYTIDNGKVTITDKGKAESGFTFVYQFTGRKDEKYLIAKFSDEAKYIEYELGLPRVGIVDGYVVPPTGFNKADADRFVKEEFSEFLYGKKSLDQYDQFLKTLEDTFQYKMYTESVETQVKELGLIK
ncbi:extracellular solute-binding protein [Paenibacillus sp. FSL R10-2734]|uniref:extracellular solute-binding protein n=1 Tax=Paenibacillus sp. FSL R10-2734 TaxID=2954691 RepID=UPI0030DCD815